MSSSSTLDLTRVGFAALGARPNARGLTIPYFVGSLSDGESTCMMEDEELMTSQTYEQARDMNIRGTQICWVLGVWLWCGCQGDVDTSLSPPPADDMGMSLDQAPEQTVDMRPDLDDLTEVDQAEEPPRPLPLPTPVPDVETAQSCVTLESGETLASVSPDGRAWLLREEGEVTHVRVVDPLDVASATTHVIPMRSITKLRAWSGDAASVLAQGSLWRLEGFARVRLTTPTEAPLTSMCGSFLQDGHVFSDAHVSELRDASWWVWGHELAEGRAPSSVLGRLGECFGPDGVMWATGEDGTLWQLQGAQAARPRAFEALVDAAATAHHVAAIDGEILQVGSRDGVWVSWDFQGRSPSKLTASADSIWVQADGTLYRWRDGQWAQLTVPTEQTPTALMAYSGGLWWATAEQACHQSNGPSVRVRGHRPFERTRSDTIAFQVSADSESLQARVGERDLEVTPREGGGWDIEVPLDAVGWHEVTLTLASGDARVLHIERIPFQERSWAQDIQPLFEVHCADCHGAAAPTDLSTYESWVERADKVRESVVETQTMPPDGSKKSSWDQETVGLIKQWLDGGVRP